VYLYAVSVEKLAKPQRLSAPGIDNSGLVIGIPAGDLTAWASVVDASSFAAELERSIENLDWLAEATLRHQKAVSAVSEATKKTLLPTRFGVVFSSLQALREDVASRAQELKAAAKHVEGCEEWGVKVFHNPQASPRIYESAQSGSDYLRRKSIALGGDSSDDTVQAFARDLQRLARDVARSGKVSAGQKGLHWQATFLLPRAKRKQWDIVLRKYAQQWGEERSIECTGPWPPYSFVSSHG
jgi:hypothetical protein